MKFSMRHKFFKGQIEFSEDNAPEWLTSENSIKGSTMDQRWFWTDHVLTLHVGESIETDFNIITRTE